MARDKEASKEKSPKIKASQFIRKHGLSVIMGLFIVIMLVSPDAKSWVLRQLMRTGIFNARIEKKGPATPAQTATDFYFEDENGNMRNLSSLRGRVVFINFWASWCPPCRAEFPSIVSLYAKLRDNTDVFFLTINEDKDVNAARDFLKKENYAVPVYTAYGDVPAEIFSGTLPTTLVLDKAGKIRFKHEGFANYGSENFMGQIGQLIKE